MCTSNTLGKQGANRVAVGWSLAKNFQWLSYQNWNITGGGQLNGLWGEAGGETVKAGLAWEQDSLAGRRGDCIQSEVKRRHYTEARFAAGP